MTVHRRASGSKTEIVICRHCLPVEMSLLLRGKIMSSLILRSGRVTTLLRTRRLSMQQHATTMIDNETEQRTATGFFILFFHPFFLT